MTNDEDMEHVLIGCKFNEQENNGQPVDDCVEESINPRPDGRVELTDTGEKMRDAGREIRKNIED